MGRAGAGAETGPAVIQKRPHRARRVLLRVRPAGEPDVALSPSFVSTGGWNRTTDLGVMNPKGDSSKQLSLQDLRDRADSGATPGATRGQKAAAEVQLQAVIDHWARLSPHIRMAIAALVSAGLESTDD